MMKGTMNHGFLGGMIVEVNLTSDYPFNISPSLVFSRIASGRAVDAESSSEEGEVIDQEALENVMNEHSFMMGEDIEEVVNEADVRQND